MFHEEGNPCWHATLVWNVECIQTMFACKENSTVYYLGCLDSWVEFLGLHTKKCHARTVLTIRMLFVCVTSPSGGTHISQVEGNLQVVPEHVGEVGIHVQHFQQVVSQDLVKVAVGQSSDVSAWFTWPSIQTDGFTKDVVLSCTTPQQQERQARRKISINQ